jgi:FAD:protein FMN transferase
MPMTTQMTTRMNTRTEALLSPRRRRALGGLAALGWTVLAAGCHPGAQHPPRSRLVRFGGTTMGSTFSVRLAAEPSMPFTPGLQQAAGDAVTQAFDDVVRRMSSFEHDSELSRFNRHTAAAPFSLSADTIGVLEAARRVSLASGGAFDVTVAPLVGAWGFGAEAEARGAPPSAEQLAQLGSRVGWRGLEIDPAGANVRKALTGLQIDLSGIAKGHAVDRAGQALDALGLTRWMVEAGGEIRTRGLNADGEPWRIAVERPDAWPPQVYRVVPMQGLAIATSGDYRQWYEVQGRRVHHEIDPATRAPAGHGGASTLASVSVLHEECRAADAWATALFVLGAERGMALARRLDLAALFIVRDAARSVSALAELVSPAWMRHLAAGRDHGRL